VEMVGHKAIPMHTESEALHTVPQKREETKPVIRIEKDILSGIAAQHDMVDGAGAMQSWFAWHGDRVS